MNHYETVFILTPVLSDDQMKEAVEKFKGVLTADGATIVNEEQWGLRKLAYPIQKKTTGFNTLIEFDGEPTLIKKLETAFRRDELIIRFLTFHLDKYAAEYAAKRRSLRAAKAAAPKEEPKAAPAEEEAVEAPAAVEEAPVAEVEAPVVEEAVEAPAVEEPAAVEAPAAEEPAAEAEANVEPQETKED